MELIKSHINKVYYWIIISVIIVALALVAFYRKPANMPMTEEQKLELLNQLEAQKTSNLTDAEKTAMLNDLSSGTPVQISDEEKMKILNSLQ